MLKIGAITFNPIQENTYIVSDETGQCVIIDAGNSNTAEDEKLFAYIDKHGLLPVMAVNTHGHIDHILGASAVTEKYGIPFAIHSGDRPVLMSAPVSAAMFGLDIDAVPEIGIDLKETPVLRFGNTELHVVHTPGHTPGGVTIFDPVSKAAFTGDTLFKNSIGRTDLPGGDYPTIVKSIIDKILPLGGEVKVFPGHGPQTTIGGESLYNPFITEVVNKEVTP